MKGRRELWQRWMAWAVVSLAFIAQACSGSDVSMDGRIAEAGRWIAAGEVPFHTLEQGAYSGIRERAERVIEAEQAWKDLWLQHQTGVTATRELPGVDFTRQMVIAVFMGEQRSGGFAIEIEQIEERGGRLEVTALETSPPPGTMVTQVVTQPYHIVAVDKKSFPITFTRRALRQ